MRPELLERALDYISDEHITQAAKVKKRHPLGWASSIAAVLALAVLLCSVNPAFYKAGSANKADAPEAESPGDTAMADESLTYDYAFGTVAPKYVAALAEAPRVEEVPIYENYKKTDDYNDAVNQWFALSKSRRYALEDTLDNLDDFLEESLAVFLDTPDQENRVYSPVNSYIALAMLAEVTGGDSRQQILDVLDTPDLETLRSQVSAVFESVYMDDESGTSILANSFWLDDSITYNQDTLDNLAHHHYASSYRGDLGTEEMDQVLRTWLNEQTGGLLEEFAADLKLNPESILALASTVYLRSFWSDEFDPAQNTQAMFHAFNGDIETTFMNLKELDVSYYRGENYGAIPLRLANGCRMWLYLPDEGTRVSTILEDGDYLDLLTDTMGKGNANRKFVGANISIPKFDVSSSGDLCEGLQELGITNVFDPKLADFSPTINNSIPAYVGSVNQAARVRIDEEGLEAASYVVIDAPGAAAPDPEKEIIDFVLDRPFLFVIERSNMPLFAGVVNEP